ncbi:MAG: hypothetical protein LDL47_08355 [Cyanobacteria bacterium KgW148]|nr:hypothetical protein [Cyanobacteria bacterium KgW148]
MNYLIATCTDRIQAETLYSQLESQGIPQAQLAILGRGYKSADEFGLVDPVQKGRKQAILMATWLLPFGFGAGVAFSLITQLHTFDWAGTIGDILISGLLGAIGGAMGSVFVGGGAGVAFGSSESLPLRNRLDEGKYLVVVRGTEELLRRSRRILEPLNPEKIQSLQTE